MPKRVTQVEQRTITTLVLVATDDVRLYFAGTLDGLCQGNRIPGKQTVGVLLQPIEVFPIDDEAIFDDFGESCAQLAIGQRAERIGVRENGRWLMECANQILAARMIDPGLAAHG